MNWDWIGDELNEERGRKGKFDRNERWYKPKKWYLELSVIDEKQILNYKLKFIWL